jgi:hypothetical protein
MTAGQRWTLAGLAITAALTLGFGALTSAAYQQARLPLPTEFTLVLYPTRTRSAAAVTPAARKIHLPLLTTGETASATPAAPAVDAPALNVVTAAPSAPAQAYGYQFRFGHSSQGRDITGLALPATNSPMGLVLVCGIHGDEVNAWPVLERLWRDFNSGALTQPPDLSIYFVPALNPDGAAAARRLNANGVDLNRNWDTNDWRKGVELPTLEFLPGGGGPYPFSEPETQAMSGLLTRLGTTHTGGLTVLYFHAVVPPNGLVMPGSQWANGQEEVDGPSQAIGRMLAANTGYDYSPTWVGNYPVTGDASSWAVSQGYRALTIELPTRDTLPGAEADRLYSGILALIGSQANP